MLNQKDLLKREGDIYKTVTAGGHSFTLYYGYYEDFERRAGEPVVVYPDLNQAPVYSPEGYRVVTAIQDVCPMFRCRGTPDEDSCCCDCVYYPDSQSCINICTCPENRRSN